MARHVWHVDKAPGHLRRNRNACLKVNYQWVKFVRVHTASDANWLSVCLEINSSVISPHT